MAARVSRRPHTPVRIVGHERNLQMTTLPPVSMPAGRRQAVGVPRLARARASEDSSQNAAFYCGLAMVFLRFSDLHNSITVFLHVNTYLLYIVGIPAVLGVLAAGGLQRTLRFRPGRFWLLFGLWLLAAAPFSSWPGDSVRVVLTYWRTNLLLLFVLGGLAISWRRCRMVMYAVAAAAVVMLVSSRLFGQVDVNDRVSLDFGIVSNSNDYAAHLILVLPFVLWVGMTRKTPLSRALCGIICACGLYVVLATGSRGAMIAIVVQLATFVMLLKKPGHRAAALIAAPALFAVALVLLPDRTVQRIWSFSKDENSSAEAMMSSDSREYVLRKSIEYTVTHPIFGVGANQFGTVEGRESRSRGDHGAWLGTHNSFTQISSENGILALAFYLAGIVSTFLILRRAKQICQGRPQCRDVETTIFCVRLGMIGYLAASTFVNFGYMFYLPALAGLAISIYLSACELAGARPTFATAFPMRGRGQPARVVAGRGRFNPPRAVRRG